ncbi:MAG: hypothetical protein AAF465_11170 [Pseudomonadota bacterium]
MTIRSAVSVQSPGKLFLLGEYAVLFGAPAIVRAVDRYVHVRVEPVLDPMASDIEVVSRGLAVPDLNANWDDKLVFVNARPEHSLVTLVLGGLAQTGTIQARMGKCRCTIDSRELFYGDRKLGLGSSAAVTHALIRAFTDYTRDTDLPSAQPLDELAFTLHRAFQNGRGSGADLGAGVLGGHYRFQRVTGKHLPDLRAVAWPDGLHCATLWVGRPASTASALAVLSRFERQNPGAFTQAVSPLLALAQAGSDAFEEGDVGTFVRICHDYAHTLAEFGAKVGVDIVSAEHRSLQRLATEHHVVYKPSGAGNGDFGVAFSHDKRALNQFAAAAQKGMGNALKLGVGRPCHRL